MEIEAAAVGPRVVHAGAEHVFCSEGCRELFQASPARYTSQTGEVPGPYDLVIVGGGPAGLTAAVYASIQRIRTLIVTENIGGQAVDSTRISNYMGFDFISGKELVAKFRDQLIGGHFVEHRLARVTAIRPTEAGYDVETQHGEPYRTRTVLIATGMSPRRLPPVKSSSGRTARRALPESSQPAT